jgi:hypothetical protein
MSMKAKLGQTSQKPFNPAPAHQTPANQTPAAPTK